MRKKVNDKKYRVEYFSPLHSILNEKENNRNICVNITLSLSHLKQQSHTHTHTYEIN